MHFSLPLAVALLAAAPDIVPAHEVGDLVVAVRDADLRIRRENRVEVTDAVFPGVAMRVGAVQGRWLWVSNGVPGWIDEASVIP
ncbi:MAG: hypothetical protein KDA41_17985, partial [Planctomycetales bacterium]|nr:hypothetical protein [Planctomycetales bacterium]